MLCLDRFSNLAWVGLTDGIVAGYNLTDNVATHYLYSSGVELVGNYAACGCPLSSVNHVLSVDQGVLCVLPYHVNLLSRNGGSPISILANDAFENMPEDSHISTSLLGTNSIHLSVYNYLLAIDPNTGKNISCATLCSPIVSIAGYNGESSNTCCGMYINSIANDINTPPNSFDAMADTNKFPYNPLITVGTLSGNIELFDIRENESVTRIKAYKSRIIDLSCKNFYIASVGLSVQGAYEPIVRLYDLRMLKSHLNWVGSPVNKVHFINDNQYIATGGNQYHICDVNGKYTTHSADYLRPGGHIPTSIISFTHSNNSLVVLHSDYSITVEKLPKSDSCDICGDFEKLNIDIFKLSHFKSPQNGTNYPQFLPISDDDHSNAVVQFLFFCPGLTNICTHVCLIDDCTACMLAFALKILVTQQEDNDNENNTNNPKHTGFTGKGKKLLNYSHKLSSIVPKSCDIDTIREDLVRLLDKVHKDLNMISENTLIHDIFGITVSTEFNCSKHHKTDLIQIFNSLCINSTMNNSKSNNNENDAKTFINILNETLHGVSVAKASCKTCNSISSLKKVTKIVKFSNLIFIECLGDSSIWKRNGFIPREFYINNNSDNESKNILKASDNFTDKNSSKYTLITVLSFYNNANNIQFATDDMAKIFGFKTRLIVYSRTESGWIMINGSHMDNVNDFEPTNFSHPFMLPIGLIYKKEVLDEIQIINPKFFDSETSIFDGNRRVPLPLPTIKCPVPCTVFLNDKNLAHNLKSQTQALTFTPLTLSEIEYINNANFMLALDIECVRGDMEKRKFFKPLLKGMNNESNIQLIPPKAIQVPILARISMIRASGILTGIPFIDHYVYHKIPPKDYLTRYSGLFSGDLDLRGSKHWLTSKKLIYLKIRYLVDSGCTFIGHGITNDFQILSIAVPKSQVIDTVEIYRLPGQRYISLQFLAAHLLKKKIQHQTHDSIQDAITAMELYKLYLKASKKGSFQSLVAHLYQIGYATNWKIPY